MSKTLRKTKILRTNGSEFYMKECLMSDGTTFWEVYRKDTSARGFEDKTFKAQGHGNSGELPKVPASERVSPPANWTTDLLSGYARNEYADGHKPNREFRWR